MAFDGQYFDLNMDKKLAKLSENLNYDFLLPMWDIVYRSECVWRDVCDEKSLMWICNQVQVIGNLMKTYNCGIGYEEIVELAEKKKLLS